MVGMIREIRQTQWVVAVVLVLTSCRINSLPVETPEAIKTLAPPAITKYVTATPLSPITESTVTFPITPTKFSQKISDAHKIWESTNISNYQIMLRLYENFANGIETERDVTVTNGEIAATSCPDDKCPIFILGDVYTVDDLFFVAQGGTLALMFDGLLLDEYDDCVRKLEFDATYGFPELMQVDCSNAYDEDHSFVVISFEELK